MAARRFIGREAELARLQGHLDHVRESGAGRMLALRGRRQIGKSRLVEEFIRRSGAKAVFYTASRQSAAEELRNFGEQIAASGTDGAAVAAAGPIGSWEAALSIAASGASAGQPIVLVIDELPFLIESEPAIEGIIQKQWDRSLEAQPVLLLLIGSDVSMMSALSDYGRPLYGRLTEMTIGPLSPAAIGDMLGLSAVATFDAYLTIGGFPRLAEIWHRGEDVWKFLRRELQNPGVAADRARRALAGGGVPGGAEGARRARGDRRRRANVHGDPAAGGHLEQDIGEHARDVDRQARGRQGAALLRAAAPEAHALLRLRPLPALLAALHPRRYPGDRAWPRRHRLPPDPRVVPVVRRPRDRAARARRDPEDAPRSRFGGGEFVGAFWNRDNSVEVDLVGGRGQARSREIDFAGSIKWRARDKFDRGDLSKLTQHRALVPGASEKTLLVGVSRSGFDVDGLDVRLNPEDLLAASHRQE